MTIKKIIIWSLVVGFFLSVIFFYGYFKGFSSGRTEGLKSATVFAKSECEPETCLRFEELEVYRNNTKYMCDGFRTDCYKDGTLVFSLDQYSKIEP